LAGNNEDGPSGDPTSLWFVPPEDGKYGYVAYGYSNHFSQGGMNDQGLFWDGLATPLLECTTCDGQQPFTLTTLEEVMQDSATVQEAIDNLRQYNIGGVISRAQFFIADANGDSAIFEGDEVITPEHNYQIGTNFYQSDPSLGNYPCWRYELLEQMMQDDLELTMDYFTEMAEAAHQGLDPGAGVYTRYTTVHDLKNGFFYLYFDMDWDRCIKFDLAEELSQPAHEYLMADLTYELDCGGEQTGGAGGGGGDGGAGASSGGGAEGGVGPTPGLQPGDDDSGCGCRVRSADSRALAPWLVLTAMAAGACRRRRRR
jgi:hypothetical protein